VAQRPSVPYRPQVSTAIGFFHAVNLIEMEKFAERYEVVSVQFTAFLAANIAGVTVSFVYLPAPFDVFGQMPYAFG
jgi:hypothetical protein